MDTKVLCVHLLAEFFAEVDKDNPNNGRALELIRKLESEATGYLMRNAVWTVRRWRESQESYGQDTGGGANNYL